ncbi:MAG: hypothetical protein QNI96_07525 [Woeseiaceae bacterium]|nr:hypothetical protein [Woeseiaceae bacterium]
MRRNKIILNAVRGIVAAALFTASAAHAFGPLYIHDYATGTPYRWDVTTPVPVYTDGGNFASGSVWLWVNTPETCNAENGWQCGYSEELYVEFTNEQGVTRVEEALASWSSVPTSSFQAAIAGSFAEVGLGGADGDITGASEEFSTDANGDVIHEIVGAVNNGGIHVIFDEDGSVMRDVMGVPYGVLGIATPEWADEETGIITEGWAVIGGANTYYNDTDLEQIAGVVTHELGHSFNLAHTQTNGHIVFYGAWDPVTPGPRDCSAHWSTGGEYRLPFPQWPGPGPADVSVMYPFVDINPADWNTPTGEHQATASTSEDFAAISAIYPADNFEAQTGTIKGSVTYAFSTDGVIGVNVVARNVDNPWEDAITAMTGDWNDGVAGAAQGEGEFILQGLTPGARYVIHVENIYAGGFPTPQVSLPGPSEYYNGGQESDDAARDDACEYAELVVGAGETLAGIDFQMNGMAKTPQLVIMPAPNANNVTESGKTMAGTIVNWYGETQSWIRNANDKKNGGATKERYTILPLGGITASDNGSVFAGRTAYDNAFLAARYTRGKGVELVPDAGNTGCDLGDGTLEKYSHFAISPDGKTMGGFLWACDNSPDYFNYIAAAATYDDDNGWTYLGDYTDGRNSRVNGLANDGTAVGWKATAFGNWEGRIWRDGAEINMKDAAPAGYFDVGEATAVSSSGEWVVGVNAINEFWEARPYRYNTATAEFEILDISEPCPPFDWFCWGSKPFNPYDLSDDGTMVGAVGTAGSSEATIVAAALGGNIKLVDFLKGQGVINATDLALVSNAAKISSNGKHIVGWTAVDGYFASFKITLDQLYVCDKGKSKRVGYPGAVATKLAKGATLGMCEADLPLQYK